MKDKIVLRKLLKEDCEKISEAFKKQGWTKPIAQYELYLKLQKEGKRDVIIAELEKEFVGYLTIQWTSDYIPFRERKIPEIVDMNVLKKYQRKGIASCMMDEAEKRIKKVSDYAGIGFGVTKDYGAAQKMYINRNYKPDRNGLVSNSKPLEYGEKVVIDDSIVVCLIKEL